MVRVVQDPENIFYAKTGSLIIEMLALSSERSVDCWELYFAERYMTQKSKVKGPVKTYSGTILTSEEEERKFRKQRGQEEKMRLTCLSEDTSPFGNYQVQGLSGIHYIVEFRSFCHPSNSCSCPDFMVNMLHTCKHIEATLHFVKNKFKQYRGNYSSKIEIYLQRSEHPLVCISWPTTKDEELQKAKLVLDRYFSENHTLIADPLDAIPSIENALMQAPESVKKQVHISPLLQEWLQIEKHKQFHKLTKEQFLFDVQAGKRSTQVLNANLYPYQEAGLCQFVYWGKEAEIKKIFKDEPISEPTIGVKITANVAQTYMFTSLLRREVKKN